MSSIEAAAVFADRRYRNREFSAVVLSIVKNTYLMNEKGEMTNIVE